jgi:hypothetical protein
MPWAKLRSEVPVGAAKLVEAGPKTRQCLAADHTTTVADGIPFLALDRCELDYAAMADDYVDMFMKTIDWPSVGRLLDEARES